LPKALVPIDPHTTVLDLTLANYAEVGITEVAIVVGYAADAVRDRVPQLQERYGVRLELIHNDRAETWNNAYSLWCARDVLTNGVMLANGDTVHPASVQRTLLDARGDDRRIILALDTVKSLADEEMKVIWSVETGVERITKLMDPAAATGEYIGVTLIEPTAAADLGDALRATWERDPHLYYEDGYQLLVDRGYRIDVAPIGAVDWVEIDDHNDLVRAREIVCPT
jgi:choline kinase